MELKDLVTHRHTTFMRRWINVIDVDLASQQRRAPSGWDIYDDF